jgi:predicted Zn-dependent protease with MMP-like domain
MAYRVSKADFERLVARAVEDLPEQFAQFLEEIPIEIRDRPTPAQRRSIGLPRNELLLGLYHGRPLTHRSVEDSARMPDVIYIFQDSIEAVSENEDGLVEQVRTTVLHEIGHYFGMNEDDLDALGYG